MASYTFCPDCTHFWNAFCSWYNEHLKSTEAMYDDQYISDWNQLYWPTTLLLANISDTTNMAFHYRIQTYLRNWLCTSGNTIQYSKLGRAFNTNDASLAQGMNSAFLAMLYAQMVQESQANVEAKRYTSANSAKRYLCWAQAQARYVLGDYTRSFIVGIGNNAPTHIYDRASSCPKDNTTTCNALNALHNPKPNPNTVTGALVYGAGLNGDYFIDQRDTTNGTMVSHLYNTGITGTFAGLAQMVTGNSGYDQCLQGYGVLSKTIDICKKGDVA